MIGREVFYVCKRAHDGAAAGAAKCTAEEAANVAQRDRQRCVCACGYVWLCVCVCVFVCV